METYVVKSINFENRLKSRSGGFFFEVATKIINNGGIVYGCVLDDNLQVKHIRGTSLEEIKLMQGSKYVQSVIGNSYLLCKKDLDNGEKVLFSGTPCQIAGLKSFLNKDYENLFTIDIVCHGVSSQKVFHDYINYLEEKYKKKVINFNFRNKEKYGWDSHYETIYFDDDTSIDSQIYQNLYYSYIFFRKSCFDCKFKNLNRVSDITIADAWSDKFDVDFDDNNGISLILINTNSGRKLLNYVQKCFEIKDVNIKDYLQSPFKEQLHKDDKKIRKFQKVYNRNKFSKFLKKYYLNHYKEIFIKKLKRGK